MKRKLIAAFVIAAAIGTFIFLKYGVSTPARTVELAAVERKEIRPSILASGNLVFRQEVQLSSEVIGKVTEVLVKEGDKIEQGQVLLRLNPSSYRAEVEQQEANRRSALVAIERAEINTANQQRNLQRSQRLLQDKFINVSAYDEAVHQMDLAKLDLRASRESLQQAVALLTQARERLAKTEVRSPISGTVTAVQIKVGETAIASVTGIAGSSLMTIANMQSMMAEVNVDEANVGQVVKGLKAQVFPAMLAGKALSATVESVSLTPKVSTQGRNYIAKLRLEGDSATLRTGMTCRAEIVAGGSGAKLALPIQAIMTAEATDSSVSKNSKYVFVVLDGVVRKRMVEAGLADDANQEILKGLSQGDQVVVGSARVLHELRDGEMVTPVKAGAVAAKPADKGAI